MSAQVDGPFFVPRYKPPAGGVDFLGLRQVNLDLMDECLPGINNVTRRIRPFSVICWAHHKFYELAREAGESTATRSQYKAFLEKAESLFTWGHQLAGKTGIPGIQSKRPSENDRGEVPLAFKAWRRNPDNTSLMAAVQYGPASKSTAGLGFLEPVDVGLFRVRGHGVALAAAIDQKARLTASFELLNHLGEVSATESQARSALPVWDVDQPSKAERSAFRSAFFDPAKGGSGTRLAKRSGTIDYMLTLLRRDPELSEGEIRRCLAYRRRPAGRALAIPPHLADTHVRWFVLQIRQAQRIAFESLLAWVEYRLLAYRERSSERLAKAAADALVEAGVAETSVDTVRRIASRLVPIATDLDSFCDSCANDPAFDVLAQMADLGDAIGEREAEFPARAARILFLAAAGAGCARQHTGVRHGGSDRVSLFYWNETVRRCADMPLHAFLLFLIENLVLSQHFAVAAGRFDGEVQRLRVSIEEEGLVPLVGKPWRPNITPDRLPTALSLACEAGLMMADEAEERFSALE